MYDVESRREWKRKLQEGKLKTAERCCSIAMSNLPINWRVKYRKSLSGRCYFNDKLIEAPKPSTRRSLHIFLHECGHAILHGTVRGKKKRYVEEYEAEQYAFGVMRKNGIKVPRKSLERAKSYVRYKIEYAQKRGLKKVDAKIHKWAFG